MISLGIFGDEEPSTKSRYFTGYCK